MLFRATIIVATLVQVFLFPLGGGVMAAQVTTMTDCEKSPFSGSWISVDSGEPFLSRLEVTDVCKLITTKPVATNNPWAGDLGREKRYIHREFTIRPSSTCSPIDCVWGRSRGEISEKGSLKAQFRMFWSQRFLELMLEKETLRVRWRIEYIGRKKPDQLGETLLLRAE
jgi:hypothetical protein